MLAPQSLPNPPIMQGYTGPAVVSMEQFNATLQASMQANIAAIAQTQSQVNAKTRKEEKSGSGSSCCFETTKKTANVGRAACPILVPLLAIYALFTTVSSSFLFDQFLTIPGMKKTENRLRGQVSDLKEQVDLLNQYVDELSIEIDRFAHEVDNLDAANIQLKENNRRFAELNRYLAGNVTLYAEQNEIMSENVKNLTITVDKLEDVVDQLNATNEEFAENIDRYAGITANLTTQIEIAGNEMDKLEQFNKNLTIQLEVTAGINSNLTIQVRQLGETNTNLSHTIANLTFEVDDLQNQTEVLANATKELRTVVQFLNTTASGIDQTLDASVSFLNQMIEGFHDVLLYDVEYYWDALIFKWRCNLDSAFGSKNFTQDSSLPIGDDFVEVMEHLERVIFKKMCVDMDDMNRYIFDYATNRGIDASSLSVSLLSSAIAQYYTLELNGHYFSVRNPNSGDPTGPLSMEEWAVADFECSNLPPNRVFTYY